MSRKIPRSASSKIETELTLSDLDAVNGGWFAPVFNAAVRATTWAGAYASEAVRNGDSWLNRGYQAYQAADSYLNPTPGNGAPGDSYHPATANPDGSINPGYFRAPPPTPPDPNQPQVPMSGSEAPTVPGSYNADNAWRDSGAGSNAGYGSGTGTADYAGYDNVQNPGGTNAGYGEGTGTADYAGYDNYQNPAGTSDLPEQSTAPATDYASNEYSDGGGSDVV